MTQDELKQRVAAAAIHYVMQAPVGSVIGVGSGSTANLFIDELAKVKHHIKGAVASSVNTAKRLAGHGITVFDLNDINDAIPVYVDGADEINARMHMIKGGGGALTREKIVAGASQKFICICDETKLVKPSRNFGTPPSLTSSRITSSRAIVITSTGSGNLPSVFTSLVSSQMQMNFCDAPATIFSRVSAPPPPLIMCMCSVISSAPST